MVVVLFSCTIGRMPTGRSRISQEDDLRTKRFTRTVAATALAAGVLVTSATAASALGLGDFLRDRGLPVDVDDLMGNNKEALPISGAAEFAQKLAAAPALPGSTTKKPLAGPVVPTDAVGIIEVKRTVQTFTQSGLSVVSSKEGIAQIGDLAGGF